MPALVVVFTTCALTRSSSAKRAFCRLQSCAIALGPYGIRCNALLPGAIATDINQEDLAAEQKPARMIERTPLGAWGTPTTSPVRWCFSPPIWPAT